MEQMALEMLLLQNDLNNQTNGIEWRKGYTTANKKIDWKRCIYMECAELIDSFPWKHWKNVDSKADIENIKLELVDIWHFLMSYLLKFDSPENLAKEIQKYTDIKSEIHLPKEWTKESEKEMEKYIDIFEELMALALIKSNEENYRELLTEQFFRACDAANMDFNELYGLYIGKNALNRIRQEFGYKQGQYKKIWGEEEDNKVMQRVIKREKHTFDSLYERLKEIYQSTP